MKSNQYYVVNEEQLCEISGGDDSITCKNNQQATVHEHADGTYTVTCDAA